jgi:prepilin-type N-terminal cleavage/methylation domain-containing protein
MTAERGTAERGTAQRQTAGREGAERAGPGREGFTLLEVLVAVFVFATVLGTLVALVSANLARLGDARRELDAARRAEAIVREVETNARLGVLPDFGTTGGVYDPPDDDLRWEQVVDPFAVPLPPELAGQTLPYSIFSSGPAVPTAAGELAQGMRLVRVWVYPTEGERESVDPFAVVVSVPPGAFEEEVAEDEAEAGEEEAETAP